MILKQTKFLEFILVSDTGRTKGVEVRSISGGYPIGKIAWWGRWRQYCFFPEHDTVFNKGCIEEIVKMIDELMAERRK